MISLRLILKWRHFSQTELKRYLDAISTLTSLSPLTIFLTEDIYHDDFTFT